MRKAWLLLVTLMFGIAASLISLFIPTKAPDRQNVPFGHPIAFVKQDTYRDSPRNGEDHSFESPLENPTRVEFAPLLLDSVFWAVIVAIAIATLRARSPSAGANQDE